LLTQDLRKVLADHPSHDVGAAARGKRNNPT